MKTTHPLAISAALLLAALTALFYVPACTQPQPGQPTAGPPSVVSCGTQAVTNHATDVLPGVNACLAGQGGVMDCLAKLVQPAAGIIWDTVLCVTRHEGSASDHASKVNPGDVVDRRKADRAREALQGVRFED